MELRKKWLLTLLLVMTFLGGVVSADGHSIAEIAKGSEDFTVLSAAIEAAGLTEMLDSRGPFTVFAPTDDAFAKIPQADLEAIVADSNLLRQILLYHVIQGEVPASEVVNMSSAQTALGKYITIQADENGVVINGSSNVIAVDVDAENGLIHVIDTVLIPPAGWGPEATEPPATPPPAEGGGEGDEGPASPPAPEMGDMEAKLADAIAKARFILEQMGGVLDRSSFGTSIACDEFNGYYEGLKALPTYTDEELPPSVEGIHAKYREAVDLALDTNMSISEGCADGGTGSASPLNFSIARTGINNALNILFALQDLIGAPPAGDAPADPPPAEDSPAEDPPAEDAPPADDAPDEIPPGIGADLLAAMEEARMIIETMGGVLDSSSGGSAIDCDQYLMLYDKLKALPTYTDEQLPPQIEGLHDEYRRAVDHALETNEAIYLSCEGGGTKSVSSLNFGVARQGINEALNILIPAVEAAPPIIASLPPSDDAPVDPPPADDDEPETPEEEPEMPEEEPDMPDTPATIHPVDRNKDGSITMTDYNMLVEEYEDRWSRYNFDGDIIRWGSESFYLDTTITPVFIQALQLEDPSGVSAEELIRQNPEDNCLLYLILIQGALGAPDYSGVPGDWSAIYNTYFDIIIEINVLATPFLQQCINGEEITDDSVALALDGLDGWINRLNAVEVMVAERLGVESFSAMGGWLAVAESVEGNTYTYYFSADYLNMGQRQLSIFK